MYAIDIVKVNWKKLYLDSALLHQKYVEKGQSVCDIAKEISCSTSTVQNRLRIFGIGMRSRKGTPRKKHPRYGKRYVKGEVVEHLAEMRVVKSIIQMSDTGLSLRQIAKVLDELKVPTKQKGKKWHPQMVSRILQNYKNKKD